MRVRAVFTAGRGQAASACYCSGLGFDVTQQLGIQLNIVRRVEFAEVACPYARRTSVGAEAAVEDGQCDLRGRAR